MKPKGESREVDYFTAEVLMNDFIDNEMRRLKPAELKLALVIWRKTIGWGKFSETIGAIELRKRAKLNKDTVKDTIKALCDKVGIKYEQARENGVLLRRRYTWPMNERVRAVIEKAREGREVGGKLPPTPRGQTTPDGGGQNPPTQSYTSKSIPLNDAAKAIMANALVKRRAINLGDLSLYMGDDEGE